MSAIDSRRDDVPEQLQLEVILAFGTVHNAYVGGVYWDSVWKFLCARYPDMLEDPTVDYPSNSERDMALLNTLWDWQEQRRLPK